MTTPLRVLIVEDSEDDMALLVRELRRGGYEPTFERVETPASMTTALGKNQWDLVICDYSMPHFSGTAALRLLRDKGSEVPFIFLSGTIGEETAIAALKQGAQDYVMKDNLKRLLPAIQRELGEAEQRRERKRLEHQVQELQKFEAIGRLAGGIAHDFNNALGVILGWAQLGYDNVPDNRPVRENFRMIRDQAQRSAGLTRQLANRGAYKGRNLLSAAKRSGMPTISSIPSRALLGQNPWLPLSCSGPTGSCGRLIVEFRRNRAAGITAISEHALPAVGPLVACTLWTRFSKEQPRHRLLRPRRDWVAPGTLPWRLRLPACVDK